MTVGYVTIEEADAYVLTHYLSGDVIRAAWQELGDDDKSVLLQVTYDAMESLTYRSRKFSPWQQGAFPRWPTNQVPQAIKDAQCANAIALSESNNQEDVAYYDRLKSYGISSYRVGNLSEMMLDYWATKQASSQGGPGSGIISQESVRLLQPYLMGGFEIV